MDHICPCNFVCERSEDLSPLFTHGEGFRFVRGDQLWQYGNPATTVVAVCTGTLKLYRSDGEGRRATLDLVHRGGIVGESAVVPHAVRPASCAALSSGRGMRLESDQLRALLDAHPQGFDMLLNAYSKRVESLARRVQELSTGSVEHRLARVLLRIGEEMGLEDARGVFLPLRLTRGDLSEMANCRVETAIRVMTRWQRAGMVETRREGLVLQDVGRLQAVQ